MSHQGIVFGTELRRRRTEVGLSLTGLARLVHYSKSHLSKVETGGKPPSRDLARRCDAVLACNGALARLAEAPTVDASEQATGDSGEVWVLSLDADGTDHFGSYSRREVMAGGIAAGLVAFAGAPPAVGGRAGGGPGATSTGAGQFPRIRTSRITAGLAID